MTIKVVPKEMTMVEMARTLTKQYEVTAFMSKSYERERRANRLLRDEVTALRSRLVTIATPTSTSED